MPRTPGGLPILGYVVHMDDALGGPLRQVYAGTDRRFVAIGLLTGYTYRAEVRAVTARGDGTPAELHVAPCGTPGPVRRLRTLSRSTSFIRLGWEAPEQTGGCPLLGYVIFAGASWSLPRGWSGASAGGGGRPARTLASIGTVGTPCVIMRRRRQSLVQEDVTSLPPGQAAAVEAALPRLADPHSQA